MRRSRLRLSLVALGGVVVTSLWFVLGAASAPTAATALTAPAARTAATAPTPTTITVTAGKPSELSFTVSKFSNLATGTYIFKVTNKGVAFHNFEICTAPIPATLINTCAGAKTAILKHGESATLTVTFSKAGVYEFLCSVTGHAAAGMKGLIGVGIAVTQPAVTAPTTTTKSSSTAPGSSANGLTSPCPPGQTIITAGNADADGDETGAEHDDGDGCV